MKQLRYCPQCKHALDPFKDKHVRCSACRFTLYLNPAPAVEVIIENSKGGILFARRKVAPRKGTWDLPGGFVEYYETAEEGMRREAREELGIELIAMKYVASVVDRYTFRSVNYHILKSVFSAKLKPGAQPVANDDVASVQWFAKRKIPYDLLSFPGIRTSLEHYYRRQQKR